MVAETRSRPLPAVLAAALLAVPSLALLSAAPTAAAQSAYDLMVGSGDVAFFTSTGAKTWFLGNHSPSAKLTVTVHNLGNGASPEDVAIYYWFTNATGGVQGPSTNRNAGPPGGCIRLGSIPGATVDDNGNPVISNRTVTATIAYTRFHAEDYNLTVRVNQRPTPTDNVVIAEEEGRTPTEQFNACGRVNGRHTSQTPLVVPGPEETALGNNERKAYFVWDKSVDLTVLPYTDETTGDPVASVQWCEGPAPSDNPATGNVDERRNPLPPCTALQMDMEDGNGRIDVTRYAHEAAPTTHFRVLVRNIGSWTNLQDYGNSTWTTACDPPSVWPNTPTCPKFNFTLEILAKRVGSSVTETISPQVRSVEGVGWFASRTFSLVGRSGEYDIVARINPTRGFYQEGTSANDHLENSPHRIAVRTADLSVEFVPNSGFKTDPRTGHLPDQRLDIQGKIRFFNTGLATVNHTVPLRVFVNRSGHSTDLILYNETIGSGVITPNWSREVEISYTASRPSDVGLGPGEHRLFADIDNSPFQSTATVMSDGQTTHYRAPTITCTRQNPGGGCLTAVATNPTYVPELNENNNSTMIKIYVRDENLPIVENAMTKVVAAAHPGDQSIFDYSRPGATVIHPKQPFMIYANVTDNDVSALKVFVNFTLDRGAGQKTYREYSMFHNNGTFWRFLNDNFTFATQGNNTENWTARVIARDTGNEVNGTTFPFRLDRWPIQTAPVGAILITPPTLTANLTYGLDPEFRIKVLTNQTGFKNNASTTGATTQTPNTADITTDNLAINITPAGRPSKYFGPGNFTTERSCDPQDTNPSVPGSPSRPRNCANDGIYVARIAATEGDAGVWNASIQIMDLGNETRYINVSLNVKDEPPRILSPLLSTRRVNVTENVTVSVNITDDVQVDIDSVQAFVNLTKPDGQYANLTLTNPTKTVAPHPVSGANTVHLEFNRTLRTGFGRDVPIGGELNVTFWAVDKNKNWNFSNVSLNLEVVDGNRPSLHDAIIEPRAAEILTPVKWTARASDDTNFTVWLKIQRADEVYREVKMTLQPDGSFQHSENFSVEGIYAWKIFVRDSVGQDSDPKEGLLTIAENLGPRFELLSPNVRIEGQQYGPPAGRVEILITDKDNVNEATINFTIQGTPVTECRPSTTPTGCYELLAPPAGTTGKILAYTIPESRRFAHDEVVALNLSAVDRSVKTLKGFQNLTWRVDAVAPTSVDLEKAIGAFEPRYRARDADVWNVSTETQFRLAATDEDGLPTKVDVIRYSILSTLGGPGAERTYTPGSPFRIDAPVYRGPTTYIIHYWAEDSVGNKEPKKSLTVYVDGTAPSLDQFGSLPQGRFINATFVDDRSGVDRAVVVWRVDNGLPTVTALEFQAGVWSTVLPEGRKGSNVSYYLQAWDKVNNTDTAGNSTVPYNSYTVGNHLPSIRITAPATGSKISRTVDLTWNASDEDNDPLVFTIFVKDHGKDTFRELARLEAPGVSRYPLVTTNFPDGDYTFRVSVNDGQLANQATTTVSIINSGSAVGVVTPPPREVSPGSPILLKAEIKKADATVEARVYRDGVFVQAYPMNDRGEDGDEVAGDSIYTATAAFDDAGDYSVEIFARYREDGELKETIVKDAATFSVPLTAGGFVTAYAGLLVLAGLVIAALVGATVYFLRRKR